jgi:hypothetical protein
MMLGGRQNAKTGGEGDQRSQPVLAFCLRAQDGTLPITFRIPQTWSPRQVVFYHCFQSITGKFGGILKSRW